MSDRGLVMMSDRGLVKGLEGLDLRTFKLAMCPIHKDRAVTLVRIKLARTGAYVNRYYCRICNAFHEQPLWEEVDVTR